MRGDEEVDVDDVSEAEEEEETELTLPRRADSSFGEYGVYLADRLREEAMSLRLADELDLGIGGDASRLIESGGEARGDVEGDNLVSLAEVGWSRPREAISSTKEGRVVAISENGGVGWIRESTTGLQPWKESFARNARDIKAVGALETAHGHVVKKWIFISMQIPNSPLRGRSIQNRGDQRRSAR